MKAQFKYSFLAGLHLRLPVFLIGFIAAFIFAVCGSQGMFSLVVFINIFCLIFFVFVVVMAFLIISDITIAKRLFTAPDAYLYALIPAPRRNTLCSSLVTIVVLDGIMIASMAAVLIWLISQFIYSLEAIGYLNGTLYIMQGFTAVDIITAVVQYALLILMIIFSVAVGKSFMPKKFASGIVSVIAFIVCYYIGHLLQLIFTPFGEVRGGFFPTMHFSDPMRGSLMMLALSIVELVVLFILTAKLLEKKVNI